MASRACPTGHQISLHVGPLKGLRLRVELSNPIEGETACRWCKLLPFWKRIVGQRLTVELRVNPAASILMHLVDSHSFGSSTCWLPEASSSWPLEQSRKYVHSLIETSIETSDVNLPFFRNVLRRNPSIGRVLQTPVRGVLDAYARTRHLAKSALKPPNMRSQLARYHSLHLQNKNTGSAI